MRKTLAFLFLATTGVSACGFSAERGKGGTAGTTGGGMQQRGADSGTAGIGAGGGGNGNGSGNGSGNGGEGGATFGDSCVPGVQGSLITDCGYPSSSSSPLTSVLFNESEVLRAIEPSSSASTGTVRVFYNDEHALTLGVRSVAVKTATGTTTTDYPVSPLLTDPGSAIDPQTGTNVLAGDQNGLDASLRPMWPSLFITDITTNPNSRAGDWQYGGRPTSPNAIFGSWKAAIRTVDATKTPIAVSVTPDADPAKNGWSLPGGDPAPQGLANEGFGAEVRWSVALAAGHSYRLQVIVHDGDQNKAGGDSGEACVIFCAGGGGEPPAPPPPSPSPSCPTGSASCVGDGIDPGACPAGTACANGCCLTIIP
jgi:hypothetical protein